MRIETLWSFEHATSCSFSILFDDIFSNYFKWFPPLKMPQIKNSWIWWSGFIKWTTNNNNKNYNIQDYAFFVGELSINSKYVIFDKWNILNIFELLTGCFNFFKNYNRKIIKCKVVVRFIITNG